VTIDSDSALDRRAIEGPEAFAHSDIMSVVGLEMACN
jgi:hypothetical protein